VIGLQKANVVRLIANQMVYLAIAKRRVTFSFWVV